MSDDAVYVLDTNVFIEAAKRYYAFKLAPGFWSALIAHNGDSRLHSIDRVRQELIRGKDDVAEWVKRHFDSAFQSTDDDATVAAYRRVMSWVQDQEQYKREAKDLFAQAADGWLVAHALVNDFVVVTQEVAAPDARRRIPLPNVCTALHLAYVDTFTMLQELGVQFN